MEQANYSYIDALSGGDDSFKQKLIQIVKDELPREIEVYEQNGLNHDWQKASEHVHKIKHKISILGLEKSYIIATDFENNLRENNLDLKNEFEAIMQVMTNFLETL